MTPGRGERAKRLPQLDVLRGAAVLLTLGSHPPVKIAPGETAGWVGPIWRVWYAIGYCGVDLFFVLSGFLVGGLIFAEMRASGRIDIVRFVFRRGFKIWPTYYFLLAVLMFLQAAHGPVDRAVLLTLAPYVVFLQNYFEDVLQLAPHTWSLPVEEHFYLALPLVIAAARRKLSGARIAIGFFLLAVVCGVLRSRSAHTVPQLQTHLRIDSLCAGVVVAFVYHYHHATFEKLLRASRWWLACGLALVIAALSRGITGAWVAALVPAGLYVGFAAIIIGMLGQPEARFSRAGWRIVAAIGYYSYSIYLFHVPIGYAAVNSYSERPFAMTLTFATRWSIGTILYMAISIAMGVLVSRCIELPALALRERVIPRPR